MESDHNKSKNKGTILFDVIEHRDDIEGLLLKLVPVSWRKLLDFHTAELKDVANVLKRLKECDNHIICPSLHNIFRALYLCPWVTTKVVIIGQDPYYQIENGEPAATGCCFECRKGNKIQRSLNNIISVLSNTIEGYTIPNSGDLTKWAEQDVLLLNTSLTTQMNVANAHAGIWEFFPVRVLEFLSEMTEDVVYMLWGRQAEKYEKYIRNDKNYILKASHPVSRGKYNTFLKCDHFNKANKYLENRGRKGINWQL
jgi:uracil-DNA glycosylase